MVIISSEENAVIQLNEIEEMPASKKCRFMTSGEEIESNEDLLMDILVRLEPKQIFKFKCVAPRWNNMLNASYFRKSYKIRIRDEQLLYNGVRRLLAFFQVRERYLRGPGPHKMFNMFTINQHKAHKIKELPFTDSYFLNCADGLMLFEKNKQYFVVNPVNRTWVELQPTKDLELSKLGLVCIENKEKLVPSFRIVGLSTDRLDYKTILIDTYSSETGVWKRSKSVCTETVCFTDYPYVCNGVFHWFVFPHNRLAVYDSKVEERLIEFIELPLDHFLDCTVTRSPTNDDLWLGMSNNEMIWFWILPKTVISDDEWILIHTIDKESLIKELTLLFESKWRKTRVRDETIGSPLKLEALIPSNPVVAVLSMRKYVYLYNLETKSTEMFNYRGRPIRGKRSSPRWYPLMESLDLSTYGPFARSYG